MKEDVNETTKQKIEWLNYSETTRGAYFNEGELGAANRGGRVEKQRPRYEITILYSFDRSCFFFVSVRPYPSICQSMVLISKLPSVDL